MAFGPGNPFFTAGVLKPVAGGGGGPNTWYDIATSSEDDTDGLFSSTDYIGGVVTVGQAGTATKLRMLVGNIDSSTHNIKMGLYDMSGNLLASGTATVLSTDDDVYKEVTLDTPVSVSATTYQIMAMGDDINVQYRYLAGSGAMDAWVGKTYANFPYNPSGAPDFDDLSRKWAASVFVA